MINWLIKKVIGTKNQREVARLRPVVAKINELEELYRTYSDERLIAKTQEFRDRLQKGETLDDLLPEAFAVVKNACRRFTEAKRVIQVRGQNLNWEMIPFDVQLIGGIVLHQGKISEMATGEGKTLVATLPCYLNALSGKGVHVITVNDYLAARDSEWVGEVHKFLGLTVGCIQHDQSPQVRREQYNCDITYGTNSEFGFDYLRDNGMATTKEELVQRGHTFALVDEVDSILIDEARTPLIISGPATVSSHQYDKFKPLIERLVQAQNLECNRWAGEAKEFLDAGKMEEAGRLMFKIKLSMPRNKQLLKLLEDPDNRRAMDDAELVLYQDMRRLELYKMKDEALFTMDEKSSESDLSERGRAFLNPNDPNAFVLPDLITIFHDVEQDDSLSREEKEKRKQVAQQKYDEASERIHNISQLLRAYCVFEKDVQYVVQENKVIIVDEYTGRLMPGRRWSDGLHQAVEAKEGVQIDRETQTLATITIQNYFRLYEKLGGMTGTAETEANEFHDIYKLGVVVIPTNRNVARVDICDSIYKTRREKYNAIVRDIKEAYAKGQPCLVGTVSVESSELLSRMLKREGIVHNVLNAKFHQQEAEIVARAGQKSAITIATNMAGRGTDIKLGPGVKEVGGLYVVGTERHEARRIDRQLRGRCARQGDPGVSKFYISFEDDLMRNFGDSRRISSMMTKLGMKDDEELQHPWLNKSVETAQKRVEERNYQIRKHTLQYDDVMNQQREVIYSWRNDILFTENPRQEIFDVVEEVIGIEAEGRLTGGDADHDSYVTWLNTTFPLGLRKTDLDFNADPKTIAKQTMEKVKAAYDLKVRFEEAAAVQVLERYIILGAIDRTWQEHLYAMDGLRGSIHLRAIGQKDPLIEYKQEAFNMFEEMMGHIKSDIVTGVFRSTSSIVAFERFLSALPQRFISDANAGSASGMAGVPGLQGMPGIAQPQAGHNPNEAAAPEAPVESAPLPVRRTGPKLGRNDPCPLDPKKKFKNCCGALGEHTCIKNVL
ncbi:MAG: preprotein translocase subunit SecA [Verrucomicrobia bacterium Tous-C9LFEB]|nr:MAG: preprotein translocase subunit SecA [Verrucomicrobia bacterium Tous-C9LFEB]